jgi:hypothetical protein
MLTSCGIQWLPGPVVFERHQLVEVGAAVDHALFIDRHAGSGAFQLSQAFGYVEGIQCGFSSGHSGRVASAGGTGGLGGSAAVFVKFLKAHVSCVGNWFYDAGVAVVFVIKFVPAQHGVVPALGQSVLWRVEIRWLPCTQGQPGRLAKLLLALTHARKRGFTLF